MIGKPYIRAIHFWCGGPYVIIRGVEVSPVEVLPLGFLGRDIW